MSEACQIHLGSGDILLIVLAVVFVAMAIRWAVK